MYDNSTPISGQVTSTRGNLVKVSKSNPCPHCGKPDWCYSIGELSVCNRDQPPATGWERTSKADQDGHFFYAPVQEKKAVRPAQTRYWEYPDRDGSPLVRVRRIDFGDGRKKDIKQQHWDKDKNNWVMGLGNVQRASIPIYRRADVQKAIANGDYIFIVDGEQCADALWDLGLAATTSIGGAGKWRITDTSDLQGGKVVICPDRDIPGVEDAAKISEHFPEAMWLYPFPKSKAWENLHDSQGLDIADWIEQEKLFPNQIRAAIGEKKVFEAPPKQTQKVVSHPKFEAPTLSDLATKIEQLLESDLRKSQLQIKISELAQTYRLPSSEVWKIYRAREEELEQESYQEDTAAEVARLLSAQKSGLELAEILPPGLAAPIKELAGRLNLKPECYLVAGLSQVSSLFKVGTEVLLRRDTDYRCTPNYFAGIVAESSQKKSPIMRAMIERPMKVLRDKARDEYQKALANYEAEYKEWKAAGKDKGLPPKEPRQRLYSFSKSTGEGILYQVAEFPDQALMYRCDELAGLFKSANQYRGGKGSDDEDLLEFWNGTGSTVLRASGVKADLEGLLLTVFGTIQPDVLAELLKDCSDSNGKFARFDFVFQPLAASKLSEEDSGNFDITPMLAALYKKIDSLPAMNFELSPEAKRLFTAFYNATEERRVEEPKQGIRAMVGKMPEKVGKMAAIIHTINCAFTGTEVSLQIPKSAVEAAIKFVKFSADQIASLYAEFSDRKALAPNLAKLVLLAERKGGTLSTREAQHAFHVRQRPSAQQIREWFGELESMKFGELTTVKKTVSFCLTTTTVTTVTSNSYTEGVKDDHSTYSPCTTVTTVNETTVVNCGTTVVKGVPQLEPLSHKDLGSTVVTVVPNSAHSKKSENLLLSSDHPQSLKSAAVPKAHRTFEVGQRVVVKDVGGIYQGARGEIVDTLYGRAGATYLIKFDKPVKNVRQSEFEGSDLMKL
ncbi:DUF3987 domain-containing protein [Microcoleus sp. F8-D3]